MTALAVSFGLQFRENLDFALFKRTEESFYPNHPCVWSLSNLNVSWVCQHVCILWDFWDCWCCLVMLSGCDQWATVRVISEKSVFQTWSLLLCASAIMNIENYVGDAFKHWKDGVIFKFHFSLCASVMTVHLYILCLLRNECLSF